MLHGKSILGFTRWSAVLNFAGSAGSAAYRGSPYSTELNSAKAEQPPQRVDEV